jgi:glycosyltransferase involved in cell wall biosynthesis
MGNNKKKLKKTLPTVSIVTINQLSRVETIKILAELINEQTYKNIIEWVIVEGSSNITDALENKKNVESLKCNVPVIYVEYSNKKLGELRNIGNKKCSGDITVCMDDDDYYPPTRVSHAVESLMNSTALIAGCSSKYLYDYSLKKFIQFKEFAPNHSTNDCMAWKRKYLESNSHDPEKSQGEELSFTNKFNNKMVQLDPKHTIIQNSHKFNTFNKTEIILLTCIGIYPQATCDQDAVITDFIPEKYYSRYSKLFHVEKNIEYDIIYFTGKTSIEWDPKDHSLGGSEQAIVNLTKEWVKQGKKVAVYGNVPECILHGTHYFPWKEFDYSANYKIVVLWRHAGINCFLQFPVKYEKLYADFHDNFFTFRFDYPRYSHKIDKYFFKSNYHLECYQNKLNTVLAPEKVAIIPNGIRINEFNSSTERTRNQYRFCYCSSYDRGLMELLELTWPIIYKYEPRAEFHIYYGMSGIQNAEIRNKLLFLMSQPGVMDHSRQPLEIIAREKWTSSFHLYPSLTDAEIDCISIRESMVCGCIPILSNFGVFKERDGIHFDLESNEHSYKMIGINILQMLKNKESIANNRLKIRTSKNIVSWYDVSKLWNTQIE